MDKRFWGFLAVVVLIFVGIFWFNNRDSAPDSKGTLTNHVLGKGTTGVKLVEYGDYQCPACLQYYPALKQVNAKYGDQIAFQFRNFPLYQIHVNAIAGARAAEAADLQNKYWEMHDKLYENQNDWNAVSNPLQNFKNYAKDLGLNLTKFETDYKSNQVNDRVQADLKEGERLNVASTPTFFLDGKLISTPDATLAGFSKVLDAAIAQKQDSASSSKSTDDTTAAPAPADAMTPAQ